MIKTFTEIELEHRVQAQNHADLLKHAVEAGCGLSAVSTVAGLGLSAAGAIAGHAGVRQLGLTVLVNGGLAGLGFAAGAALLGGPLVAYHAAKAATAAALDKMAAVQAWE